MTEHRQMTFSGNETVLERTRQRGHDHEAPCNGRGTCGKCSIRILEGQSGELSPEEKDLFTPEQLDAGYRLACLCKPVGTITFEWVKKTSNAHEHAFLVEPLVQFQISEKGRHLAGETRRFGVAVDIGTTTVVATLLDLSTGEMLASGSRLNPQKAYGLDVLSRITHQMSGDCGQGIHDLKHQILETLQEMILDLCKSAALRAENLLEIAIAANTAMLHFLLGEPAGSLGKAPYRSLVVGAQRLTAEALGLDVFKNTLCYLLPPVSAYIGGDISAGILTVRDDVVRGKHLFIDIGTNGEIVLFNEGAMVACSCAAGPAFEGMNLSFGMRAEPGAVETLRLEAGGRVAYETIGGNPVGVCGSGVFDLMSELIRCGLLGKTGRIKSKDQVGPEWAPLICEEGGKKHLRLDLDGHFIRVSQSDIRQIQLAKGAVRSGIEALLNHFDLKDDMLDSVLIAGQFGKHLKRESLVGLGLIPGSLKGKIRYLGNTAKTGATYCLMDDACKQQVETLIKEVQYLELAELEGYERLFVACLNVEEEELK